MVVHREDAAFSDVYGGGGNIIGLDCHLVRPVGQPSDTVYVFMHPTGASGIPGHPRYDDCIDEYVAGAYRPLLFNELAIRAATEATLILERASGESTDVHPG